MRKIIILLFSIGNLGLNAQQLEQWTQFYMNEYAINPAVTGMNNYFDAKAMARNQWVGITDAPRTYYLSVHGPVLGDKMGVGGAVFSDITGPIVKSGFSVSYAYHLKLQQNMKLSFALSTGVFNWSINGSAISMENYNDRALSNGNMSTWKPDFTAAVRFNTERFRIGLSVPQVANLQAQLFDGYAETKNYMSRHYYLNCGYTYPLTSDLDIDANFLARYAVLDMIDLQTRVIYQGMVWLGVSGRGYLIADQKVSAMGIMAGYQFDNNLQIGYSYDYLFNPTLGSVSTGSHEIVIGIKFSKKNPNPVLPAE